MLRGDVDPEVVPDLIYGALFYRLPMARGSPGLRDADALLKTVIDGLDVR